MISLLQKLKTLNKKRVIKYVIASLVVLIVIIVYVLVNYDVTIMLSPSDEYKDLETLCTIDYYKTNHLLVKESGNKYKMTNGNNLKKKVVGSTLYYKDDDGKVVRTVEGFDEKNNLSYTWYRYDDCDYIMYDNYVGNVYRLCNLSVMLDEEEPYMIPDLKKYERYKPEFIARYKNIDENDTNKYIEEYRLHFVKDDFFNSELARYLGDLKIGYLKIAINNMNLVTQVAIYKDLDDEDASFGPFNYTYFHDKNLDLSKMYEVHDRELEEDSIKITFIDTTRLDTIKTINIDKGECLFVEPGLYEGVYFDEACTKSYEDWERIKIINDNLDNIFYEDTTLYVKEK